jgi:large subunit ribosomal protein L23
MTTLSDVIRRPLITEKSNYQNRRLHQYVFEVTPNASKNLVKDAIETIFNVKVIRVNVINLPAKYKRSMRNRRLVHRRSTYKKAIVTLAEGDTIPVFEGVK